MLLKLRARVREWSLHAVSQVQVQQVQQEQQMQQRQLQQNAAKRAADAQAVGPTSVTAYLDEVFHQVACDDDLAAEAAAEAAAKTAARKAARGRRPGILGDFDLDEEPGAPPIVDQVSEADDH
jgi:membrane protein involved in colicin uptake